MKKFFLVSLIAIIGLGACESRAPFAESVPDAFELRIMSFNIEWGGTNVSFEKVVEAIRRSGADIVGIQEAEGNLARLANEFDWHYDPRTYTISRFPVLAVPGANGRYVYVEVRPGKAVAFANVHLPSDPYGPEMLQGGALPDDVIELEKTVRLRPLQPYLDALTPLEEAGIPVFLTGDFNAPSHADWKKDMVGSRPFLDTPVDWPVSRAVEAAGFIDSWRAAHPDPRSHPGLTWWAGRPPLAAYAPGADDPQDRIDFVWVGGRARTQSSELVGEHGADGVSLSVSPWPSDHRAVVSTFVLTPTTLPRLVSPRRHVFGLQDDVVIAYRNAGTSKMEISGRGSSAVSGSGDLRFPAGTFAPGRYDVLLQTPQLEPLHSEFWVIDPGIAPTVSTAREHYNVGEAIDIAWQNGPGNRNDYLGVYEADIRSEDDRVNDDSLTWLYVNARPEGSVTLGKSTSEVLWPLPAGRYVIRLLKDDGDDVLAESEPFEVQ